MALTINAVWTLITVAINQNLSGRFTSDIAAKAVIESNLTADVFIFARDGIRITAGQRTQDRGEVIIRSDKFETLIVGLGESSSTGTFNGPDYRLSRNITVDVATGGLACHHVAFGHCRDRS